LTKLSNIRIADWKKYLKAMNCHFDHIKDGHEVWHGAGLSRPIVFQTHIEPVPEFIVRNTLRILNVDRKQFEKVFSKL
jgi:hypothetical protein